MQGRGFREILEGRPPADWRTSVYYRYYELPGPHSVQKHLGVRNDRYKLIFYPELKEWELFDLQKDPREMKSVYAEADYAAAVREMKAELERLKTQYQDDDRDPMAPAPRKPGKGKAKPAAG
jgi:arylsulfatase A-like enzyme